MDLFLGQSLAFQKLPKVLIRVLSTTPTKTPEQHQSSQEIMNSLCTCFGIFLTDDVELVNFCPILFTTCHYEQIALPSNETLANRLSKIYSVRIAKLACMV